jgi:hypothetical protein
MFLGHPVPLYEPEKINYFSKYGSPQGMFILFTMFFYNEE